MQSSGRPHHAEREWSQDPREAATTLREAGYSARQVVAAFDDHRRVSDAEIPGLLVETGLDPKEAIAAADARSFRDEVFEVVPLDCIGPNGYPVPCGIKGGGGTSAMGALSWSPEGEGVVAQVLTIESTNIPEVSVRLGGSQLTVLEATSQRIRVRLPTEPTSGDLVLVRESDGQVGEVEKGYQVVLPPTIELAGLTIDNGASHTLEQTVTLQPAVQGPYSPTHYRACEGCNLANHPWHTYTGPPSFVLSPGDGTKTVRFQVKGAPITPPGGGPPLSNESEVRTASIDFFLGERCFGAVGMECAIAMCAGGACAINGGSWVHDECCWENKVAGTGLSCGSAQAPAQVCTEEWELAKSRTFLDWNWYRVVDTNERNTTGEVEFEKYCALSGRRVHVDDAQYCCSGSASSPSVPDVPNARVCD